MKGVVVVAGLAAIVLCCSCARKNTADIPGPWRLQSVEIMNMAPAGDGQMTVTLFSANEKPRYLWMTLSFEKEPSRRDLEEFAILYPSGNRVSETSIHSSMTKDTFLVLIFEAQTGWDKSTKLMLSGMDHQVPFKTPQKASK